MDWFKAKLEPETPIFHGKTMVSGKDFPLHQSVKMNQTWISTSKCHEAHVDETST